MLLSQCEQVNVILHYLSLRLMNSPYFQDLLEYYMSQSVNTTNVVYIITLRNLIVCLQRHSILWLLSLCFESVIIIHTYF